MMTNSNAPSSSENEKLESEEGLKRLLHGDDLPMPRSVACRCREFRRKRLAGVVVASLIVLLIGAASFGFLMQLLRAEAVSQKAQAVLAQQKATEELEKALLAKRQAEEKFQEAEEQRKISHVQSAEAVRQAEIAEKQEMYARKFEQIANEQKELAINESARAAKLLQQADQTRLAFERLAAAMLPAQDDWPTIPAAELATKL